MFWIGLFIGLIIGVLGLVVIQALCYMATDPQEPPHASL